MHGLGDHTGLHSGPHPVLGAATHAAAPAHEAMSTSARTARSGTDAITPAGGEEVSGLGLDLCVAVLLGGLLTWLLLVGAGRRTPSLLPRLVRSPVPVPRSRDPDPPSPELLSVHRC